MTLDASGKLLVGLTSGTGFVSNLIVNRQGVTSSPVLSWTNAVTNSGHCHVFGGGVGITADGYLAFGTNEGGAGTFTERMRIATTGAVTIGGYGVLTSDLGTQASYNSYTAMTGGVAYKIGQLPQSAGLYAISMHMDGGLDSGGNNIYWESAWGAVIGAIGGNLYNATGAIAITVNSMYHHLTVAQPTFYIDSDNSAGAYGNQAIYVVFPQYTNVQGMTFYYKKLM